MKFKGKLSILYRTEILNEFLIIGSGFGIYGYLPAYIKIQKNFS